MPNDAGTNDLVKSLLSNRLNKAVRDLTSYTDGTNANAPGASPRAITIMFFIVLPKAMSMLKLCDSKVGHLSMYNSLTLNWMCWRRCLRGPLRSMSDKMASSSVLFLPLAWDKNLLQRY